MESEWIRTSAKMPPDNVEVEVMNGAYVQRLVRHSNLWWLSDRSMYVYFEPKVWRPVEAPRAR